MLNPGPQNSQTVSKTTSVNTPRKPVTSSTSAARAAGQTPENRNPWIIHFNCRSLVKHIDEMRLIFKDSTPVFIAITEMWLNDSISDTEVEIEGYKIERLDRKQRRGGGVVLYLLDSLKFTRRRDLEEQHFEAIWVQLELSRTKYLIGCVYRAPDESLEVFDYLDDVLRYATRNQFETIILGDLNCDCLDNTLAQSERLEEFLTANELEQLIKEPTRVTSNSASLLDVLITTTPTLFKSTKVLSTSFSDHQPIVGIINGSNAQSQKHRVISTRRWDDASINSFLEDLHNTPWSVMESFSNIDDMCYTWQLQFQSQIDKHFPLRKKRLRRKTHPWLNSATLITMRKRDQIHKKAVKSGLSQDWDLYKFLRNRVTKLNRKSRRDYFADKLEQNRAKPRAFWNILRQVLPSKRKHLEINKIVVDNEEVSDPSKIADALNEYFTSIAATLLATRPQKHGHTPNDHDPEVQTSQPATKLFHFPVLSETEVYNSLRTLDASKATGSDNIPAKALKIAAPAISQVVTHLFNASFQQGRYPASWKTAKVTPLFKGGEQTERDNFRPISVLPCLSKIQESFANSKLQEFARETGLIEQHQYAYVKHSSTTVALIKAVDSWIAAIDERQKVVSVFLDLRKAFDVIEHDILISKLRNSGITGSELDWFKSYLSHRSQFVSCGGTDSDRRTITHGVPQGSVLGPTLFNVHINGIAKVCNRCGVVLYADDTEIHACSKDVNIAESDVNKDLEEIDDWLDRNGLICNISKSEAMLLGSRYSVQNTRRLDIVISDKKLNQSNHVKYLGVYIDESLKWNKQISFITSKTYPKLKLLNRLSQFLSQDILLRIYKQTILPVLDYGCIVWGQCSKQNAGRLERLQNHAMRIILSTSRKTCTQSMRTKLGLLSLASRRRFMAVQLVHKIVNNSTHCPPQLQGYFTKRSCMHNRTLRDNNNTLNIPRTKTAMGEKAFKVAAAKEWNSLPKELRETKTLRSFKNKVFHFFSDLDKNEHRCTVAPPNC